MMKVYAYQGCSTCKNALKWLKENGVAHEVVAIRETPPKVTELKAMLTARGGDMRALFNTSGMDYRALGMKDKLPGMAVEDAIKLLSENGNLVKRPFAIDAEAGVHLVGFRADEWASELM